MSTLAQFIQQLATDPALQAAYAQDAAATLQQHGVSVAEAAAVLNGDKSAVEQLVGHGVKPVTYYFPAK